MISAVLFGNCATALLYAVSGKIFKALIILIYGVVFIWLLTRAESLNRSGDLELWLTLTLLVPLVLFPNREIKALSKRDDKISKP